MVEMQEWDAVKNIKTQMGNNPTPITKLCLLFYGSGLVQKMVFRV